MFLAVSLVAPFTFLKPKEVKTVAVEEIIEKVDGKNIIHLVEQPLHSVDLPEFSLIHDVKAKKQQFFDFMLPSVIEHNNNLLELRAFIKAVKVKLFLGENISVDNETKAKSLLTEYLPSGSEINMDQASLDSLLLRIDIVPTPLVLSQAANESAWGTSRFARIGLNFFGIWCFREGCGMVPSGRSHGAKHEVAAFTSVGDAVKRYLYTINTHRSYSVLRAIRGQLRALNQPLYANVIATGLLPYSERGSDYVHDIIDMLRHNRRYFSDFEPVITPSITPVLYVDVTTYEEIISITNNQ